MNAKDFKTVQIIQKENEYLKDQIGKMGSAQ